MRVRGPWRKLHVACLVLSLAGCSSEEESGDDDQAEDQAQGDDDGDRALTADAATKADTANDAGKATDSGSAVSDSGPATTGGKDSGPTTNDSGAAAADAGGGDSGSGSQTDGGGASDLEHFSFFLTSLKAIRELSGSQNGFGGDLRFGETGAGAGLRGADKICSTIAEMSMPGSGSKVWRAFLSAVSAGEDGGPVHAGDRIGQGPWYDRNGRLVGMSKTDLLQARPAMADPMIRNDLPNEDGVPNQNPDGTGEVDNHIILTGTGPTGQLYRADPAVTCDDWTKSEPDASDAPRAGHSWPRFGEDHWFSFLDAAGCGAGISLNGFGAPSDTDPTVGSGGGYGGFYCFALRP